ncbi:MAG: peptide ABC transporter substrate-binding protein [Firmicutes bacterium]|nr:peptide ABC transporter substrate-binding protein [[Eubacterium] siraeum]MCM1487401.1 peptide ABC transporter substrate-binding protein [Bacillota bacterium]
MKFKATIKAAAALLLIFSAAVTSAGCSKDDGTGYIFKYDIPNNPRTLDPQTANDSSSYEIIANMFEGLLKIDKDGNIQNAVAENYTVSDDGLTYSFDLRKDVYWYDGNDFEANCTANDFVFAFQRLFKPATKSKTAGDFFCIKNAESINKGYISDVDQLGVKAENDYKLIITLENPNPSFPVLLTTAPAMPCNEKFYSSTSGKYGLYADSVASNGPFYIFRWNYDQWSSDNNNIIMRINKKNNANNEIAPYSLNFFIEEEDSHLNFLNEQSHVYITSGSEAVELLNKGYEYSESENKVWGIMFNTKSKAFRNSSVRKALAYSIQRNKAEINEIGYNEAEGIIPTSINIGESSYRSIIAKDCILPYNENMASGNMSDALKTVDKAIWSGLTLYVPDDDTIYNYISDISQQWQSELQFYCNVKRLSQNEYETVLKNGKFDFIIADISGGSNNPSSYLSAFSTTGSSNYSGYSNSDFDQLLSGAENAATVKESADMYYKGEKMIVENAVFIPLINQSEYAFFGEGCQGIVYNPFTKTVIFKEAKMFK